MKKYLIILLVAIFGFFMPLTSCKPSFNVTIEFESNGGTDIPSMTIQDKASFVMPSNPSREGYLFNGWYQDNDTFLISFESAEDIRINKGSLTVYAKWAPNQYSISYFIDDSLYGTQTYDYNAAVTAPEHPQQAGYTFSGWGEVPSNMPADDITIMGNYTPIIYTIEYSLANGTTTNPETYTVETDTFDLNNPTKTGYTFIGWTYEGEETPQMNVSINLGSVGNKVFVANYQINTYTISYFIDDRSNNLENTISLFPGETIVSTSLGWEHSAAITSQGRIFTWGSNGDGQLGDGTTTYSRSTPTDITSKFNLTSGETIVSTSLAAYHSAAITSQGRIFTWGSNGDGQLGDGTTTDRSTPTDITSKFNLTSGETIVSTSLAAYHSAAITSQGRIFTWGHNSDGQLGDGTTFNRSTPTNITSKFNLTSGETIVSTSLGGTHSAAITSQGRIFAWGANNYGQLGDGTTTTRKTPTDITSKFNLTSGETIVSTSLGGHHSAAITSQGRIFTWGYNYYGQLGDGTTTYSRSTPTDITSKFNLTSGETIVSTSLGGSHSAAITSQGRIFTWGYNYYGQLGDGTTTYSRSTPTDITSKFNLTSGETIVSTSLGGSHSAAITSQGRIFTWGSNGDGQLGDGTTTNRSTPTLIEDASLKTLLSTVNYDYGASIQEYIPTREGYVFDGWYQNYFSTVDATQLMPSKNLNLYGKYTPTIYTIEYSLANGTTTNPETYTVETDTFDLNNPTKTGYTFIGWTYEGEETPQMNVSINLGSVGNKVFVANYQINTYTISYFIDDRSNNLENTISLFPGETIVSTSLGGSHSAAITSQGRIFTWGYNGYGQLGDGTTTNRSTPTDITSKFNLTSGETIVSTSLGGSHSAAITSQGRIFTWGSNGNGYGQLGDGTATNRSTPTDITSKFNLTSGETIVSTSLGGHHSAAITSQGRIFTWGYNGDGQLGDGTTTNRSTPTDITSKFNLTSGETIVSTSLGGTHSAAITSQGRIFTWGSNYYGQLGDGTTYSRSTPTNITSKFNLTSGKTIVSTSLGNYHSAAITSQGRIFTWGYNGYGQLGDGTTTNRSTPTDITSKFNLTSGKTIVSTSLGGSHSAAITSQGRIFTWGSNGNGTGLLGDGTATNRSTPTDITSKFNLTSGETIVSTSLGGTHSAAITSQGRIFTWGSNYYGQLGDGTTTNRSTPTLIEDASLKTLLSTVNYDYGASIQEYIPTREGYVFDGWYDGSSFVDSTVQSMPAANMNLYGRWIRE